MNADVEAMAIYLETVVAHNPYYDHAATMMEKAAAMLRQLSASVVSSDVEAICRELELDACDYTAAYRPESLPMRAAAMLRQLATERDNALEQVNAAVADYTEYKAFTKEMWDALPTQTGEPQAALIDAAEKHLANFDGQEEPLCRSDILNAFFAGARYAHPPVAQPLPAEHPGHPYAYHGVPAAQPLPDVRAPVYLITKNATGETVVTTTTAPFDDELDVRAFVESLELPPAIGLQRWADDIAVQAIKAWVKRC